MIRILSQHILIAQMNEANPIDWCGDVGKHMSPVFCVYTGKILFVLRHNFDLTMPKWIAIRYCGSSNAIEYFSYQHFPICFCCCCCCRSFRPAGIAPNCYRSLCIRTTCRPPMDRILMPTRQSMIKNKISIRHRDSCMSVRWRSH